MQSDPEGVGTVDWVWTTTTTTTTTISTSTTTTTMTSITKGLHERVSSIQLGGVLLHILAMAVGDWIGPRQGAGAEALVGARPSRAAEQQDSRRCRSAGVLEAQCEFQWFQSLQDKIQTPM